MNRKSVIATLNAVCPDQFLTATVTDGSVLKYVPVFEQPYDSEMMGISDNGFWCIANDGRIWELKDAKSGYIFYLLLYTPLTEVIDTIKKGLVKLKFHKNSWFPCSRVGTRKFFCNHIFISLVSSRT